MKDKKLTWGCAVAAVGGLVVLGLTFEHTARLVDLPLAARGYEQAKERA